MYSTFLPQGSLAPRTLFHLSLRAAGRAGAPVPPNVAAGTLNDVTNAVVLHLKVTALRTRAQLAYDNKQMR